MHKKVIHWSRSSKFRFPKGSITQTVFAFLLVLLVVAGVLGLPFNRSRVNEVDVDITQRLGRMPIFLNKSAIKIEMPYEVENANLRTIANKIVAASQKDREAPSAMLHAAKLQPLVGNSVHDWIERDELGRIVKLNQSADFFETSWRGVETKRSSVGDRIEHRDQFLAAVAELGIPLNCTIQKNDHDITLRDLLRSTLAEFHLGQAEMSWTSTALALYLPPQISWTNRFGEEFNFDDLALALVKKPLNSESCSGIHLMQSLTVLLKVDLTHKILLPTTRKIVRDYVESRVTEATRSQLPDGSWPVAWAKLNNKLKHNTKTPRTTALTKLIATGHLLEWFHLLPPELQPPPTTVRRGVLWLLPRLNEMDDKEFETTICPCTHAVLAIKDSID